jgi:hypothetical protein
MDGIAIKSLRDTMKLAYNQILFGKAVGNYEAGAPPYAHCPGPEGGVPGVPCPCPNYPVGTVEVYGNATSNAIQGATMVELTYVFDHCQLSSLDVSANADPKMVYKMTFTGTVTENGTLAVQPTANTALDIKSDSMTLSGTVYNPPIDYETDKCPMALGQNGNNLSGTLCGRDTGTTL